MAKASTGKGAGGKNPGAVLAKYIADYGLAVSGVALELGQNSTSFKKILDGKKRITIELALLLAKKFGTTPDFWIDLQKKAGLAEAKDDAKLQKRLKDIKKAVKGAPKPTRGPKPGAKSAKGPKAKGATRGPKGAKAAASKTAAKGTGKGKGKKVVTRKPRAAATASSSSTSGDTSWA
jgi:addiction module HigA family antidote